MKLVELKSFLERTRLNNYPTPQIVKKCTCGYTEILQSMKDSLIEYDMSFKDAWNYEISHSETTHYGRKVRDIIAEEGKTLRNIFEDLEERELISNSNYYGQPFDLKLEKELGNFDDE